MRVLLLSNMYPSQAHPGCGIFVREQVEALREHRSVTVDLIVSRGRSTTPATKLLKYLRLHLAAWSHAFKRYDIAHLHYPSPAHLLAAWPALLLRRKPLVATIHRGEMYALPSRGPRKAWVRFFLLRATAVITVSRDLRNRVAEQLDVPKDRISEINVGCDIRRFTPLADRDRKATRRHLGLPEEGLLLLFVGRHTPRKGLDVLFDALRQSRELRGCCIALVGDGPERARWMRQAPEQITLKWPGEKSHSELPSWFGAADIFVLPSRSEGTPTVVLESMACGTPVVASRVGGIPQVLEHQRNGMLFESEDAQGMADCLDRLAADTRLRERLAAQALKDVQTHSLQHQVERIHRLYRSAASDA